MDFFCCLTMFSKIYSKFWKLHQVIFKNFFLQLASKKNEDFSKEIVRKQTKVFATSKFYIFLNTNLQSLFVFMPQRFIKCQLHISQVKPERTASNVITSQSLEQFFQCT